MNMNKYKNEDYFSVIEIKTGRKIADCREEYDALMMVSFDPKNRTITKNNFLMGQVIDIEIPKQLPTNEIVGCTGSSSGLEYPKGANGPDQTLPKIKLPEGKETPVVV